MAIIKYQCDNCEVLHDLEDLDVIKDYSERVAEGEVVPSGECPDCGCLCHEVTVTVRPRFKVTQNADQYATVAVFGETRELAELDALYEMAINDSLDLVRKLAAVEVPSVSEMISLIDAARAIPGTVATKES